MSVEQMKRFMEPRSVAIFGVSSRKTGEGAHNILEHLVHYGYQGKIYPINPNACEIMGIKAYHHVGEVREEIDQAVINLPRDLVPGLVRECAAAGIKAIVVVTQGFGDANDEAGRRLQKELDGIIRQDGVRIVGPNSLGTANPFVNFSSSFTRLDMTRVPVGTACQTGMLFNFLQSGLLGKGIDLANASDISFADALEYFEQDEETRVIVLHIEGMKDTGRFLPVISRVTRKKPVLVMKTGRSEIAALAAQSHTGSLAGADAVWDAVLRQAGAIRVDSADELTDTATAFHALPLPKGRRIGMITTSGGLGVMAIDSCYHFGLEVARLSAATMSRINAFCPPWQTMGNPLDVWPAHMILKQPFGKVLSESVGALMTDPGVDAVLLMWGVTTEPNAARISQIVPELCRIYRDKPLICCLMGVFAAEAKRSLEAGASTLVVATPDRALRTFSRLAQYSSFRNGFQNNAGIYG